MSSRIKLVAGNWKMNLTSTEGKALVESLAPQCADRTDVDVVVCPTYLSIPRVREATRSSVVKLGAQDVFWMESGAYTGQISAKMLYEAGCDYCIVGHSERRGRFGKLEVAESTLPYFGETDETVSLKIKALLFQGITPILCVGESLAEREAGSTETAIETQLRGALAGLDAAEMYGMVVAYEPVWAIGTGKTCEQQEAERVCGFIRGVMASLADSDVAATTRVLYGGSVKASNAAALFAQPNIDGALVGGASLDAVEFASIIKSA